MEALLTQAGVSRDEALSRPEIANLAAFVDAVDHLHRAQQLAAKLLENLSRKAPIPRSVKHQYMRECLARGIRQGTSILRLVTTKDLPDASILVRTLAERTILLAHLNRTDEWQRFEEWSFLKRIEHKHAYQRWHGGKGLIKKEQRERYQRLKSDPRIAEWRWPLRDWAKEMGMEQLYAAAYDYNSNHVHPRFGEGTFDLDMLVDELEDQENLSRTFVSQTANCLLLMCSTVAIGAGKAPHPIVISALTAGATWAQHGRPANGDAIFEQLGRIPSEDLVAYDVQSGEPAPSPG